MNAVLSGVSRFPDAGQKRKRHGFVVEARTTSKRSKRSPAQQVTITCPQQSEPQPLCLLDLPLELLTEIFVYSSNSALPETCKYLYGGLCADPRSSPSTDGPPLWLQDCFVRCSNPTISYAVEKCLRRRFFGPETFKLYLPELLASRTLSTISVPLRCVKGETRLRELLLYIELTVHDITLSQKSIERAILWLAANRRCMDPTSNFWKTSRGTSVDPQVILKAFKIAAHRQLLARGEMFDQLVQRFGIDEENGISLYDHAAKHKDQMLLSALQSHNVRPGLSMLKFFTS